MRRWRRTGATLSLTTPLLLASCGGIRVADQALDPGLAWPQGAPRVRLERVIELERSGGVLGGLLGRREEDPGALLARPYGLAWLGDDLLVADPGGRRILRIASDGRVTLSAVGVVGAPVFLAVCPDGLAVTDSEGGRLGRLDADLSRVEWLADDLRRPTGVACDADTLYVVETGRHRVLAFSAEGERRVLGGRGSEAGRFNFPTSLAVDGSTLLVGDTLNFRVQRLAAASGAPRGAFGRLGDAPGETPRIKGVAVDAQGQVWVADAHTDRVSLYDSTGGLLLSLGGRGGAPGRFSFPAGVAAHPDGRVAVADSFNRRIQVFRLLESAR